MKLSFERRAGTGPLYFCAQAQFFSLEEPLKPAGNEIFVRRQYYQARGPSNASQRLRLRTDPLNDSDTVKSGDRVEAVITIEAKNNYEYLLFEDLKPAGLEAVQIRSGDNLYIKELKSGSLKGSKSVTMNYTSASDFTGRNRWVYQELRDRKVALFIDHLPEGVWQMRYEFRAESPGYFHALPVIGHRCTFLKFVRTDRR